MGGAGGLLGDVGYDLEWYGGMLWPLIMFWEVLKADSDSCIASPLLSAGGGGGQDFPWSWVGLGGGMGRPSESLV